MIDKCFNPTCGRELRYLRDGRVVRVVRGGEDKLSVEHYWLCGACLREYDFIFPEGGKIAIRRRLRDNSDEVHIDEVFLTSRAS